MRPYAIVFGRQAARALRVATKAAFAEVESTVELLAKAPHRAADFTERSDDDREVRLLFLKRCALSNWIDDAAREIRILLFEPLGR